MDHLDKMDGLSWLFRLPYEDDIAGTTPDTATEFLTMEVSRGNHPATEANSRSRLLSLPAEIRNSIHEYALRDDNDNICAYNFYNSYGLNRPCMYPMTEHYEIAPSNYTLINQLQYVCRQLRAETKDVELRCNIVNFPYGIEKVVNGFPDFVESLSLRSQRHLWLNHVRLFASLDVLNVTRKVRYQEILIPMVQLCKTMPRTKFRLTISDWLYDLSEPLNWVQSLVVVSIFGLDSMADALKKMPWVYAAIVQTCNNFVEDRESSGFRNACEELKNLTIGPDVSDEDIELMDATQGAVFTSKLPQESPENLPKLPRYWEWMWLWEYMAWIWARCGIKPYSEEGSWTI